MKYYMIVLACLLSLNGYAMNPAIPDQEEQAPVTALSDDLQATIHRHENSDLTCAVTSSGIIAYFFGYGVGIPLFVTGVASDPIGLGLTPVLCGFGGALTTYCIGSYYRRSGQHQHNIHLTPLTHVAVEE